MEHFDIREKIAEADIILVGLGEEFIGKDVQNKDTFEKGNQILRAEEMEWLIPFWQEYCSRREGTQLEDVIRKIQDLLSGKNYYVVCLSTDSRMNNGEWGKNHIVMPCGNNKRLQCVCGCENELIDMNESLENVLQDLFQAMYDDKTNKVSDKLSELGTCNICGKNMVINTVYAENYNEKGYLDDWNLYTKWLQGTLNKKLLILELGVGMKFPSVIRWPFEKVAYFNKKAEMIRVNERFYQLTPELADKGISIPQNSIEWLLNI